jgi:MarR family transcriptional regulator, transcriptional regulator for hemolysin
MKKATVPAARRTPKAAAARTPKLTDPDNWDARLGFLMHDVSRLRRSVFDEFMKPVGLTRSQWWILAQLSRNDGMIQSDLAGVLDLGKAALGGLIDRLEASGFIERRPDDTDRRVKRIHLTNRGARMIEEMRVRSHEMSERMLEGLDLPARHALAEHLARVKQNLLEMKAAPAFVESP